MTALATTSDVAARWRSLSDDETDRAEVYLDDASAELRRLLPDVDDWISDGDIEADLVTSRVAWAVIRLMMNPERLKSLNTGSTAEVYSEFDGSGFWFTAADLAVMTPGTVGGAFSIILEPPDDEDDDLTS